MALALKKTVAELLETITSEELTYWQIYDEVDPIGSERQDFHAALISSVIASFSFGNKRQFQPKDFMPDFLKSLQPKEEYWKEKFRAFHLMSNKEHKHTQ